MNRLDEGARMLWIHMLVNTMTQVEYMARTFTVTGQDLTHFFVDALR